MTPGPNLFVVGAAKAGTSSLWTYLDAHPDVFMSKVKEPHFFSAGGTRSGQVSVKDAAGYARLFARGARHRYRGEASPSYLWDAETAGRIKGAAPDARIIVSLRDPVERAWSNYLMAVRLGYESRTFAQVVQDEFERDDPDLASFPPPHIARGVYVDQVRRYLDVFGDATIVLLFEELVADVRGTMRSVFERLGLDPRPADRIHPVPVNPHQLPRNASAKRALEVPGLRRAGELAFRGRARTVVRRAVFRFDKPELDPALRSMLREHFAPHNARLSDLLGRPLPWGGRE